MGIATVSRLSMHGFLTLKDVENVESLIEQVDHASSLATSMMRLNGITLTPGATDVPLRHEVDTHLRHLVCEAYDAFCATREAARREASPTDWEVQGDADDDLFAVVVTGLVGAPRGFLTLRIHIRLT